MLAYKDAVEALYSHSVAEFTARQDRASRIDARTKEKKWGVSERDDEQRNEDSSPTQQRQPLSTSRRGPRAEWNPDTSTGTSTGIASPFAAPLIPISVDTSSSTNNNTNTNNNLLTSLAHRLTSLQTDFRARVNVLLGDLAHQPDTDMRFLGVVMNFNDVYRPVRRRRGGREKEKEKERERDRDRARANQQEKGPERGRAGNEGETVAGA